MTKKKPRKPAKISSTVRIENLERELATLGQKYNDLVQHYNAHTHSLNLPVYQITRVA